VQFLTTELGYNSVAKYCPCARGTRQDTQYYSGLRKPAGVSCVPSVQVGAVCGLRQGWSRVSCLFQAAFPVEASLLVH
jgi:hypothetical protein